MSSSINKCINLCHAHVAVQNLAGDTSGILLFFRYMYVNVICNILFLLTLGDCQLTYCL